MEYEYENGVWVESKLGVFAKQKMESREVKSMQFHRSQGKRSDQCYLTHLRCELAQRQTVEYELCQHGGPCLLTLSGINRTCLLTCFIIGGRVKDVEKYLTWTKTTKHLRCINGWRKWPPQWNQNSKLHKTITKTHFEMGHQRKAQN